MLAKKFPITIRLLGFPPSEGAELSTALNNSPREGPSYFCLLGDSLQEADISIANGDDMSSLAVLVASKPSPTQPAMVIGGAALALPYPQLARPLDAAQMYATLAGLARERDDALGKLPARAQGPSIERRRRIRLDLDVTDPDEFPLLRQPPPEGAVLVVDKRGDLRDHIVRLLAPRVLTVEWTDNAANAVKMCEEMPVAAVLINTSTPDIDPYDLCAAIKRVPGADRVAVVLLVNRAFGYDTGRARAAGVRGLLDKPMADRHLLATLKKLLSLSP